MTTDPSLLVEQRGAIEILTLNRPAALNALSEELVDNLIAYFTRAQDRFDVRVILLRGAGRGFCAGMDLKDWKNDGTRGAVQHSWRTQRKIAQVMRVMRSCPQPIIALGHGSACGGGFSLMLASDVRYGAPSLRMNAAYIKIGLGGCDIGSSYFLPRLVGASIASEFLLTGNFMNAERALSCNLISEIVPEEKLLDKGLALAADMLSNAPMGLRLTKDALNVNIDANGFDAALALEDRQQVMLTATSDHVEAINAFLEKRPTLYKDA